MMGRAHVRTFMTAGALLALWGTSFGLSYVGLGAWAVPVALAIAVAKAALVATIFMELARASASVLAVAFAALVMVALLVGLASAHVATRAAPVLVPPIAR